MFLVHKMLPSTTGVELSMSQPSSGFHTPNNGNFGKDLDCCPCEESV